MHCEFCCGAERFIKDSSLEEIYNAIDKLAKIGTERIVLSGGEPLIRSDIVQIIDKICSYDIKVYLSSNGILLNKYYDRIKDKIECLGLPIDSYDNKRVKAMSRDDKGFNNVITFLEGLNNSSKRPIIKIGTVVTKINIKDVDRIGKLLFDNDKIEKPDVWRLYEFSPLRYGKDTAEKFSITPEEFRNLSGALIKKYPAISALTNDDSDNSYVFLTPDLRLEILRGDDYLTVADMKTDDIKKIKENLENKNLWNRSKQNRMWLEK